MKKIITIIAILSIGHALMAQNEEMIRQQLSRTVQLGMVTVDPVTWKNLIVWEEFDYNSILSQFVELNDITGQRYSVFRFDELTGKYLLLGHVEGSKSFYFLDKTSEPGKYSYKYKITADLKATLAISFPGFPTEITTTTLVDSCKYHKTVRLTKDTTQGKYVLNIEPYEVERINISDYVRELKIYIYRSKDSINIINHANLYDSVSYKIGDSKFIYTETDPDRYSNIYYYVGVVKLKNTIDYTNPRGLKIKEGPYDSSISNLEDNRLKAEETVDKTLIIKKLNLLPNPANDYIFTNANKIKIYDIQGKLLIEKSNISAESIQLTGLAQGIYFVKLYEEVGEKYDTQILVKE